MNEINEINEINGYLISGGIGLIALLFGALVWFVQRLIKTLDRIDGRVYQIDTVLATSETRLKTETEILQNIYLLK